MTCEAGYADHIGENAFHLRQTVPKTVVTAVITVGIRKFASRFQRFQNAEGELQLFCAGLAARHVQRKIFGLIALYSAESSSKTFCNSALLKFAYATKTSP